MLDKCVNININKHGIIYIHNQTNMLLWITTNIVGDRGARGGRGGKVWEAAVKV